MSPDLEDGANTPVSQQEPDPLALPDFLRRRPKVPPLQAQTSGVADKEDLAGDRPRPPELQSTVMMGETAVIAPTDGDMRNEATIDRFGSDTSTRSIGISPGEHAGAGRGAASVPPVELPGATDPHGEAIIEKPDAIDNLPATANAADGGTAESTAQDFGKEAPSSSINVEEPPRNSEIQVQDAIVNPAAAANASAGSAVESAAQDFGDEVPANSIDVEEPTRNKGNQKPKDEPWQPILPVPEDVDRIIPLHKRGKPVATWDYRDEEGRLLYRTCRFEWVEDGKTKKEFFPLTYCMHASTGRRGWRWKAPLAPRPLFGLDRLAARPNAPVIVVEGEKKCAPAERYLPDHVAVSAMGGAGSARYTDWSPLKGRDVRIWPDADEPGRRYPDVVKKLVLKVGAREVGVVRVPTFFEDGWDLADALPEGWDERGLRVLLDEAALLAETLDDEVRGFSMRPDGLWHGLGHRDGDGGDDLGEDDAEVDDDKEHSKKKKRAPIRVAGLFKVVAMTRNDESTNWGRLLEWRDPDGVLHQWAMPSSELAGDTVDLRKRLLDEGLEVGTGRARPLLNRYLSAVKRQASVRCVARGGWHGLNTYVLRTIVFGSPDERIVLQSSSPLEPLVRRGSFEGWQEAAKLAVGNSRVAFMSAIAFAGPLLALVGEASFLAHLFGQSSIGKTIAQKFGSSAWGKSPKNWRTTDNALEQTAAAANDGFLPIDELAQVEAAAADAIAYMLANEAGKSRMARSGAQRATLQWRLVGSSTGELSLAQKLTEGKRTPRAGQAVRVLDIPADPGRGHGIFEDLHGRENGAALVRELDKLLEQHQGHAIDLFLTNVVRDRAGVAEVVTRARDEWVKANLPAGADGQVHRVAMRFGLVAAAGELARDMGILPWPEGESNRAAAACFTAWLRQRGGKGAAELLDGIVQVRRYIESYGDSRFQVVNEYCDLLDEFRGGVRAGFRCKRDGEWEYWVLRESWKQDVCVGRDSQAIAAAMKKLGMLRTDKNSSSVPVTVPGMKKMRVYCITSAIFDDDSLEGNRPMIIDFLISAESSSLCRR